MTSDKKEIVEIFCDGACRGNPGVGGWGSILRSGGKEKELSGFSQNTTNNKMELTAAIESLRAIKKRCDVTVYTDSKYVVQGITTWIFNWKKKNWMTAGRKPVKNRELWEALDSQSSRHKVKWKWVKGHAGHIENERADELANIAIDANY